MAKVIKTDDGGLLVYLSSAEVRAGGYQDVVPVPRPQVTPSPVTVKPAEPGTGLLSGFNAGEGPTTDQRTEGDQTFLNDVLKG